MLRRCTTAIFSLPLFRRIGLMCYVAGTSEATALLMIRFLMGRNFGVISDMLGEEVLDVRSARAAAGRYIRHLRHLAKLRQAHPYARIAISLKLSQLGLKFDKNVTRLLLRKVHFEALRLNIGFEIDMEGPETMRDTMDVVRTLVRQGGGFRLALPANQSGSDRCLRILAQMRCVSTRIVKGAYSGDITRREEINANFRRLFEQSRCFGLDTALGTHDTALLPLWQSNTKIQMLFEKRGFVLWIT